MSNVIRMPEVRPVNQRVGVNVHIILMMRGKTQAELGARLGVTQSSMSRRIAGRTDWSPDDLDATARFLGVSVGRLFDELPNLDGHEKGPESGVSGPSLPHLDSNQEPIG